MHGVPRFTGAVVMGNKGTLMLGSNQVLPEMHGDPLNAIPRFQGHPVGGVVYSNTPPVPWIEAQAGSGGRGAPAGAGARGPAAAEPVAPVVVGAAGGGDSSEDQMFNANKRDWINCIKSRGKPLCDLESGHRPRSSATSRTCRCVSEDARFSGIPIRKWSSAIKSRRHVHEAVPRSVGRRSAKRHQGLTRLKVERDGQSNALAGGAILDGEDAAGERDVVHVREAVGRLRIEDQVARPDFRLGRQPAESGRPEQRLISTVSRCDMSNVCVENSIPRAARASPV